MPTKARLKKLETIHGAEQSEAIDIMIANATDAELEKMAAGLPAPVRKWVEGLNEEDLEILTGGLAAKTPYGKKRRHVLERRAERLR
jgi:hypothetical protein